MLMAINSNQHQTKTRKIERVLQEIENGLITTFILALDSFILEIATICCSLVIIHFVYAWVLKL